MFVVIGAATGEIGRLGGTVGIAPPVGAARSGPDMVRILLPGRLQTRTRMELPRWMVKTAPSPHCLSEYHTVGMVEEVDGLLMVLMVCHHCPCPSPELLVTILHRFILNCIMVLGLASTLTLRDGKPSGLEFIWSQLVCSEN